MITNRQPFEETTSFAMVVTEADAALEAFLSAPFTDEVLFKKSQKHLNKCLGSLFKCTYNYGHSAKFLEIYFHMRYQQVLKCYYNEHNYIKAAKLIKDALYKYDQAMRCHLTDTEAKKIEYTVIFDTIYPESRQALRRDFIFRNSYKFNKLNTLKTTIENNTDKNSDVNTTKDSPISSDSSPQEIKEEPLNTLEMFESFQKSRRTFIMQQQQFDISFREYLLRKFLQIENKERFNLLPNSLFSKSKSDSPQLSQSPQFDSPSPTKFESH